MCSFIFCHFKFNGGTKLQNRDKHQYSLLHQDLSAVTCYWRRKETFLKSMSWWLFPLIRLLIIPVFTVIHTYMHCIRNICTGVNLNSSNKAVMIIQSASFHCSPALCQSGRQGTSAECNSLIWDVVVETVSPPLEWPKWSGWMVRRCHG